MRDRITTRIQRDELQGLLATSAETQQRRRTAPIPAVTLEALLQPEEPPPPPIQVNFRRTPKGSDGLRPLTERGVGLERPSTQRETARFTVRNTEVMAAVDAAGLEPPRAMAMGSNPAIQAVIDRAVDAAIDREIHGAEIDLAIDAVVIPTQPSPVPRYQVSVVAASFALSFLAGILIMFLLR